VSGSRPVGGETSGALRARAESGSRPARPPPAGEDPARRPAPGSRRPRPADDEVTGIKHHTLANCPDCGTQLTRLKVIERFIEDILPLAEWYKALKRVIKHLITTGYCPKCKERKTAIFITPQISTLGDNLKQYIGFANIIQRLSYAQIKDFLQGTLRFKVSEGEITNILAEHSIQLHPEFTRLKEQIQAQPGAHYDETTWPVQQTELGNHAWVMAGTETPETVLLLGRSRGQGNIYDLQGQSRPQRQAQGKDPPAEQVAITDDYGAYKNPFKKHQLCWSHPHRKLRDLKDSEKLEAAKKKHCVYKSSGDLVTGEPVKILLYLAILDRLRIFLVRLALGFLIVVDSSTANKVLLTFKN